MLDMEQPLYNINLVSRQSGVSQHTIRAWEKRYGAVRPVRTDTNRRLYSSEDIEKLSLLNRAVQMGHSIGRVAGLSVTDLRDLTRFRGASSWDRPPERSPEESPFRPEETVTACLAAVRRLDTDELDVLLHRAGSELGIGRLLEEVVLPLVERIGVGWQEGSVRVLHEHAATTVITTFLGRLLAGYRAPADAPGIVVTTPVGQLHEIGALAAALAAASEGWKVTYLGPNLPAHEIAGAAFQARVRAVAISIVYPPDDPRLDAELVTLQRALGAIPLLIGGRAASAYEAAVTSSLTRLLPDLASLRRELQRIRLAPVRIESSRN